MTETTALTISAAVCAIADKLANRELEPRLCCACGEVNHDAHVCVVVRRAGKSRRGKSK